jgi:hypothetical protein
MAAPQLAAGAVSVIVDATDDVGLSSISVAVDGAPIGRSAVSGRVGRVGFTWATEGLPDGPHELVATATDAGGNQTVVTHLVAVDNDAPLVLIAAPTRAVGRGWVEVAVASIDRVGVFGVLLAADGSWVGASAGGGLTWLRVRVPASGTMNIAALAVDWARHVTISNVVAVHVKARPTRR